MSEVDFCGELNRGYGYTYLCEDFIISSKLFLFQNTYIN